MKFQIDSLRLEELISKVNNRINNELIPQVQIIRDMGGKVEWKGLSRDAAVTKYNDIVKEILEYGNTITMYMKFLEIVVEKYGENVEEIKKEILNLIEKEKMEKNIYEL